MEIGERLLASSREEWRAWLAEHHQDRPDIWLVLYKSGSGKQTVSLSEAQEESLCFGWIDSALKPIDAESYAQRFTPRRKKSNWSNVNRVRAAKLLREGKMAPAGMALLPPDVISAWEEENRASG